MDGIKINGVWFSQKELPAFCTQKIGSEIPEWERKVYRFLLDWINNEEFILQTSSGTTGKKKEFHLLKTSMRESARLTCEFLDLKKNDSALLCLPIDYIAGKMMVVRAWQHGLDLQLTDPGGTPDLSKFDKIDFSAMVPLQVFNLLQSGNEISKIKKLIIGGGEIRSELEKRLQEIPADIFASYGMAETCSHVALRKANGPDASSNFSAIPGVELKCDERDCLVIKAAFLPEKVRTNDVVEFASTNVFRWLGRIDNLINSGGVKIIPEEMEEKISKILGCECALIGIPDEKLGTKLVLVIEENSSEKADFEIFQTLTTELKKLLVPKEIKRIKRFPRNASFKIDRKLLRSEIKEL